MSEERHHLMRDAEELGGYIGDGVYVSFDGEYIWLRCERDGQIHEIGLEPSVWDNLKIYVERKIMGHAP